MSDTATDFYHQKTEAELRFLIEHPEYYEADLIASAKRELRQFRSLCKRFWSAETQTEYLTNQAHNGKPSPMFAEQALVVRQTWRAWNQAAVYHFKFGPAMQADYDHMARAASSQQHILDLLPAKLTNREFLKDEEIVARENEVQDYLAKLLPASPVTGRPYRATLLKMRLK